MGFGKDLLHPLGGDIATQYAGGGGLYHGKDNFSRSIGFIQIGGCQYRSALAQSSLEPLLLLGFVILIILGIALGVVIDHLALMVTVINADKVAGLAQECQGFGIQVFPAVK